MPLSHLLSWCVLGFIALPFAYEVMIQTVAQGRLYSLMSPQERLAFPPHPRSPWLLLLGSEKFFASFLRYILTETSGEMADEKLRKRLQMSLRREMWLLQLSLISLVGWACWSLLVAP
jgi:hypothetical protein